MQAFQIETLLEAQAASERTYTQFLRVPALHAGIYTLPAQGQDTQNPHREDEVYYVFKGTAKLRAGGSVKAVNPYQEEVTLGLDADGRIVSEQVVR